MGKLVGDFHLLKKIGSGAFSTVYLAENTKTGKEYAIKVIDRETFAEPEKLRRVKLEIDILKTIHHPNLICLHGIMHSETKMYLVLDYAPGGAVFDTLMDKGAMDENQARRYFHQLIDAIDWLHRHNTIHRDLKPENLLLDEQGNLRVTDFGLSIVTEHTVEYLKTRCGTPQYIAPEILMDDVYLGPPADLWSAGLILYVMLAALMPFDGDTMDEILNSVLNAQIYWPKDFPPLARKLIEKLVVRDPSKRGTVEDIRKDPWFAVDYVPTAVPESMQHPETFEIDVVETKFQKELSPEVNAFDLASLIASVELRPMIDSSCEKNEQFSFSATGKSHQAVVDEIRSELTRMNATVQMNSQIKALVIFNSKVVSTTIDVVQVFEHFFLVKFTMLKGTADLLRLVSQPIRQRLTHV